MRYALVEGRRHEAEPALSGECPACGSPVTSKCGEVKVWHWAHQRNRICDKWWESETEWHRNWKHLFPEDWQEIVHRADTGEKHIADVKTPDGWVIEFQHSFISPEERRSRNAFYGKLVWVVDATRRSRDRPHLVKSWESATPLGGSSAVRRVWTDECALHREWADSPVPVFFDSGASDPLWWLLKTKGPQYAYVAAFPRDEFLLIHRAIGGKAVLEFGRFVNDLNTLVENYEARTRFQSTSQHLRGFETYLARRRRPPRL